MKKLLLVLTVILAFSSTALAQRNGNGNGASNGSGNARGDCYYYDCSYGDCNYNNRGYHHGKIDPKDVVVKDAKTAKGLVAERIKSLKGYKIESVETIKRNNAKFDSFRVYVVDGSGNKFFYNVFPMGNVRGPVAYEKLVE